MQCHDENMPQRAFRNEDLNQTTQVKTLLMTYSTYDYCRWKFNVDY